MQCTLFHPVNLEHGLLHADAPAADFVTFCRFLSGFVAFCRGFFGAHKADIHHEDDSAAAPPCYRAQNFTASLQKYEFLSCLYSEGLREKIKKIRSTPEINLVETFLKE